MIENFKNYLLFNRGLAQNTVDTYVQCLISFARFQRQRHAYSRWSQVTKHDIDIYVNTLVSANEKPATIKLHVSALRTFYKTLMALGAMNENPARFVSTPRLGQKLPKVVETEAIKAALNDPTSSEQAKAVIAIVFETGIRLCELQAMRAEDIDGANHCIKVHGKGNKERTVYYGPLTKQYGRKWKPNTLSDREIRRQVYMALKPHSKATQLSPHAIRHTFASECINKGMSMETIRKLLGHEHLQTTEIYAEMSNKTAKDNYLRFRPTV